VSRSRRLSPQHVAVTVLTLDPAQRLAERLWSVDGLPFDTMSVVPAPKAVGGALLLSLNAVVYVNEKVRIALPLNTLAVIGPKLSALPMNARPVSPLAVPSARFVARDTALICTDDGGLHALRLIFSSGTVKSLALRRIGRMTPASTITALAPRLVFAGSRLGDSLLLHIREKTREEIVAEHEERKERARREQEEAERAAREAVLDADGRADDGGVSDLGALGGEIALIDEERRFCRSVCTRCADGMLFVDARPNDAHHDDDDDNDDDDDDRSAEEQVSKRARTQEAEPLEEIADEDNPYAVFESDATGRWRRRRGGGDDDCSCGARRRLPVGDLDDARCPSLPSRRTPSRRQRIATMTTRTPTPLRMSLCGRCRRATRLFIAVQDDDDEVATVVNAPFGMPLDVPLFRVAVCDMLVGTGPLSGLAVGRTGGIDQREADAAMQAQLASAPRPRARRRRENDDDDGDDDVHGVAGPTLSTTMLGEAGVRILPNEPKPGVGLRVATRPTRLSRRCAPRSTPSTPKRWRSSDSTRRSSRRCATSTSSATPSDARATTRSGATFTLATATSSSAHDAERRAASERENAELQALRARTPQEAATQQAEQRARAQSARASSRRRSATPRRERATMLLGDEQRRAPSSTWSRARAATTTARCRCCTRRCDRARSTRWRCPAAAPCGRCTCVCPPACRPSSATSTRC
jgi:hypothetical protein